MNRHSYSRKRLIYLEAAVPETPSELTGEITAALCLLAAWQPDIDPTEQQSIARCFFDGCFSGFAGVKVDDALRTHLRDRLGLDFGKMGKAPDEPKRR